MDQQGTANIASTKPVHSSAEAPMFPSSSSLKRPREGHIASESASSPQDSSATTGGPGGGVQSVSTANSTPQNEYQGYPSSHADSATPPSATPTTTAEVAKKRKTDPGSTETAEDDQGTKTNPPIPIVQPQPQSQPHPKDAMRRPATGTTSTSTATTTPVDTVHRAHSSSSSISSDLSAGSTAQRDGIRSPNPEESSSYYHHHHHHQEGVPPAPPSTPASQVSVFSMDHPLDMTGIGVGIGSGTETGASAAEGGNYDPYYEGAMTPLPVILQKGVMNMDRLEEEHLLLAEGAATPAPPKPAAASSRCRGGKNATTNDTNSTTTATTAADTSTGNNPNHKNASSGDGAASSLAAQFPEDFSDWAVSDRYKLVRLLGRGSYGQVAQAVDLSVGKADAFVAIKRIQSPFDREEDAVRLYREIHILRRIGRHEGGHDCIVKLLDVVQPPSDDLDDFHDLYLVFEYVDTDLYKLIMSPQYLTTEHIKTFMYQMITGLKYIHSFSAIHRDLKPSNILLNEDCSLKICDFGLARIVDADTISTGTPSAPKAKPANFASPPKMGLTRQLTKHVVTRWYRAPELILLQPYTSAVDIWSLGCILAELLSMMEENVSGYQDRKPLFPGGKCYPFSGEGAGGKKDDRLDQLSVIFGVIGTPSEEDIQTMGKAVDYVKSLATVKGASLEGLYPKADPMAIDLLKKMLQFNPKRRITTGQAIEHDFFKGIRRDERKKGSPLVAPEFLNAERIDVRVLKQKIFDEVRGFRDVTTAADDVSGAQKPPAS